MITKNVVLVLGAGASQWLGFPSGEGLVDMLRTGSTPYDNFDFFERLRINHNTMRLESLRQELASSGKLSIDSFLSTQTEFRELGKVLILILLSAYEDENKLYYEPNREDWYRYLFRLLMDNDYFTDPNNKQISILTYNYDRSLDYFLHRAIQGHFPGLDHRQVKGYLDKIPLIHLHGTLGGLRFDNRQDGRRYEPILKIGLPQMQLIEQATLDVKEVVTFSGDVFQDQPARISGRIQIDDPPLPP